MNNNNVRALRRIVTVFPLLASALFIGCASTPEPEVEETSQDPAMMAQPEAAAPAPVESVVYEPAQPIVLAQNHPERYVVVKGDTLWDISGRFLRDPWRWPEVWQDNPQVANPHLIFPGDVLRLYIIDGKPVMQVERGEVATAAGVTDGGAAAPRPVPKDTSGRPLRVVKLSPRVRAIDLEQAIPIIPMDAIRQFLDRSVVSSEGELDDMPYIVSIADEHVAAGTGYRVYARGIKNNETTGFTVVRSGKDYRDPDSGENLGKEALYLARADLIREGDPATLGLNDAKREVMAGDRLMPGEPESFNYNFMPHAPDNPINGSIISFFDAVSQVGQHQVVVLNLGKRDGLEQGHVLAVLQTGQYAKDPVRGGTVKLPDEKSGLVVVFRTFDKVSYALIVNSSHAIHLKDKVKNP